MLMSLILATGSTGAISSAIQHALGHLPLVGPRFQAWVEEIQDAHPMETRGAPQTIAWIQTAIMLLGAITFRQRGQPSSRPAASKAAAD